MILTTGQESMKQQFMAAIKSIGITPPDTINADGQIHRFHVDGDRKGSKNGWYRLYPDFPPAGSYGCHKRNISQKISMTLNGNFSAGPDCRSDTADIKMYQNSREAEKPEAVAIWGRATPATDGCKYLRDKRVKAHGLRYYKHSLLVPVMDCDGNIHGVQRIWPNGLKRFAPGTDKIGHFFQIGTIKSDTILIAEGYATAATLHEVTGHTVIVAFDAGNLLPVAQTIRSKYPGACIVICADNDQWTEGNPGLASATKAATTVHGLLAVPTFCNTASKPTDFNDLYRLVGAVAVRSHLQAAGVRL